MNVLGTPWWAWLPVTGLTAGWVILNARDAAQRLRRAQAPAPGDTRVPDPAPVPGTTVPAVPQAASPPSRQSPAPGPDCGLVRAGIGFNRNGCMYVWDPASGWQHKQHRLPFNVAEWEARLP